jgi:hypothetical protein
LAGSRAPIGKVEATPMGDRTRLDQPSKYAKQCHKPHSLSRTPFY